MEKELISVIIPVYNAEKPLCRCIESVRNQTYKNLEIILINDGSTDESGAICQRYAETDRRIKVIHKENGGVSTARNEALKCFSGEYITFVDADDYIEDWFIEKLYENMLPEIDIVISNAIIRSEDNKNVIVDRDYDLVQKTIKIDCKFRVNTKYQHCIVRNALFRRKIVCGLFFDTDLYVGEDTYFYFQAVKRAKYIRFMPECGYNYIEYAQSAFHGEMNKKKLTELEAWRRSCRLFKGNRVTYFTCKVEYCVRLLLCYQKLIKNSTGLADEKREVRKELMINLRYLLFSRYSLKLKLAVIVMICNEKLYLKLIELLGKQQ